MLKMKSNDKLLTLAAKQRKHPWKSDQSELESAWSALVGGRERKIIVFDDDPTGIQTICDVPVYTNWNDKLPNKILKDNAKVVFVWTNSRAMKTQEARMLYQAIAEDLIRFYRKTGKEFTIISRSDSTLRGNYPEETQAFFEAWEEYLPIDAELIIPCFFEGGRYTIDDMHWVLKDGKLIPCAESEFAKDKTFGYNSSNLRDWVKEKHKNALNNSVVSISLDELRGEDQSAAYIKLITAKNFDKIIINAAEMNDLRTLVLLVDKAEKTGKRFIFRTAASFVNAISGIDSKRAIINGSRSSRGLFIVGSHTELTTRQVQRLISTGTIGLEFNIQQIFKRSEIRKQIRGLAKEAKSLLLNNQSVCVYTSRTYQSFENKTNLQIAYAISNALVRLTKRISCYTDYIVAKGGITSHEIAVNALKVRKARVLGQVIPGVPLIVAKRRGSEKKLAYTIFPGNVGEEDSLVKIESLIEEK